MSGDENKLKKYRFPETLTNQSRWFGLPLDELIPAAICIGWGITTSKYLFGIGAAVLVYFGIKKLKKGRGSSWLRDLIYDPGRSDCVHAYPHVQSDRQYHTLLPVYFFLDPSWSGFMGKNKLADVCEWLHLLVVHHAGRHAGFNQVPAGL